MRHWIAKIWCQWTHGGGNIKRDPKGRINWQCNQCGRWSNHPVEPEAENWALDTEIAKYQKRKGIKG